MKPTRSKAAILPLAACAFAIAVPLGWFIGGNTTVAEASVLPPFKTRLDRQPGSKNQTGDSRIVAEIRNSRPGVERMRKTIALANSIPDSAVDLWLDEQRFRPGDGYDLTLFTRILRDRQTQLKPEKFTPAGKLTAFLRKAIVGLGEGEGAWTSARELFALLAEKDPAALETALDQMPHHMRDDAEEALLRRRLSESFETEITKLFDRPDGWRLFRSISGSPEMLTRLFADPARIPASWRSGIVNNTRFISNEDLFAFCWERDLQAAGFSQAQEQKLRQAAIQNFTHQAPEKALSRMDDAGFSPAQRKDLIQSIFSAAVMNDEQQDRLLGMLKTDEDWLTANEQLSRSNHHRNRPPTPLLPLVDQPAQWLADFSQLDPTENASHQYRRMLTRWEVGKVDELVTTFRSQPEDVKIRVAEKIALEWGNGTFDGQDLALYSEAIRILAAKPEGRPSIIRVTTTYALQWGEKNPAAAARWVASLPSGEPRDWARNNLAAQWSARDAAAADRWISSLPKEEQTGTRDFIKSGGR